MDKLLQNVLNPPPANTNVHCPEFSQNLLRDIIRSVNIIKPKLSSCETDITTLQFELKFLSQILYKNHNRFHNDKGYKDLRMLEKSVTKLLNFNFLRTVNNFLSLIPVIASVSLSVYLPPQSLSQHSLLQLYGAGALLSRVEICIVNSGQLLLQRLNLGHFWNVAAHELAVVARIWALARHLLTNVNEVYQILVLVSFNFPESGGAMLELPQDLTQFIAADAKSGDKTLTCLEPIASITPGSSGDFCIGEPVQRTVSNPGLHEFDIGVSIKREQADCLLGKEKAGKLDEFYRKSAKCDKDTKDSLTSINKKMKKEVKAAENLLQPPLKVNVANNIVLMQPSQKDKVKREIDTSCKMDTILTDITDINSLKTFIEHENVARKTSRKTALSRKLNQECWRELKKEILSNINASKPKKSIKIGKRLIKERLISVSKTFSSNF